MPKSSGNGANRTAAIDIASTPDDPTGNAVLAAWQGIYHLFGGRVERFELTEDGVQVIGFSVAEPFDPATIASDVSHRNRRLDLVPTYLYLTGQANPPEFSDPKEITQFGVQYLQGSVEDGSSRTPKYFRDANAAWKAEHNMAKRRGPRKKIFRLDEIDQITPEALSQVSEKDRNALKALLESVMVSPEANTTTEEVAAAS